MVRTDFAQLGKPEPGHGLGPGRRYCKLFAYTYKIRYTHCTRYALVVGQAGVSVVSGAVSAINQAVVSVLVSDVDPVLVSVAVPVVEKPGNRYNEEARDTPVVLLRSSLFGVVSCEVKNDSGLGFRLTDIRPPTQERRAHGRARGVNRGMRAGSPPSGVNGGRRIGTGLAMRERTESRAQTHRSMPLGVHCYHREETKRAPRACGVWSI